MKPTQHSLRLAARTLWLIASALLAMHCGGETKTDLLLGSESHFLSRCTSSCNEGLACISGLCTRPCVVGEDSCGDLSDRAQCTNQSIETGAVAICDTDCSIDADCRSLDPFFSCETGYCRPPLSSITPPQEPVPLMNCSLYEDSAATFQAQTTLVNSTNAPVYLMPFMFSCGAPLSLLQVQRDNGSQNFYGKGCGLSCGDAMATPHTPQNADSTGRLGIECSGANCVLPALVELLPGQSVEVPHPVQEFVDRSLPPACVEGLTANFLQCTSGVPPAPSDDYSFFLRVHFDLECGAMDEGDGCECNADAEGRCTGPGARFYAFDTAMLFRAEGALSEDHRIEISRP